MYAGLREQKQRAFAESSFRAASHAGASYPEEREALQADLAGYMNHDGVAAHSGEVAGLAAPHVSLEGGAACYRAAYGLLRPEHKDRTFVVLGTSHYGRPDSFGLTRKPYRTPLGETLTAPELVAELEAKGGPAVVREDYCHAVEHSIEFQVLFLQHVLGPEIRILPILCGSYARSLQLGGKPEEDDGVARFLGAIGEMAAREGSRLMWVLGIDMAHMGGRYGDAFAARAGSGQMLTVEAGTAGDWSTSPRETPRVSGMPSKRARTIFTGAAHRCSTRCSRRGPASVARCCATSSGISTRKAW